MSSRIVVAHVPESHKLEVAEKPWRVWTAIPPNLKPVIVPDELTHNINAFLESDIHDWLWKHGVLRYFSRCVERDEEAWIYLEYKSE